MIESGTNNVKPELSDCSMCPNQINRGKKHGILNQYKIL